MLCKHFNIIQYFLKQITFLIEPKEFLVSLVQKKSKDQF